MPRPPPGIDATRSDLDITNPAARLWARPRHDYFGSQTAEPDILRACTTPNCSEPLHANVRRTTVRGVPMSQLKIEVNAPMHAEQIVSLDRDTYLPVR